MKYQIGTYAIDVAAREVLRGEVSVPVEPRVFDLLLYLVRNCSRVVGKEELVERIWEGRCISDAALSSGIKAARRAIGDDGQQQRLIRTIHRRGFRFVGAVKPAAGEASPDPLPRPPAHGPTIGLGGRESAPAPPNDTAFDLDLALPRRPSVAVLPILPLGQDDQLLLTAAGLSHDITVRLARTRWLFVAARASASRLQASALDTIEIGRQLGVRYVLHGSLTIVDRRLRLGVILSDTVRGCEIWAQTFDRKIDDIFAVQDEIGDLIVAAVESEIEQKERRRALLDPFACLDSWRAYHRAYNHLYRYTPQDSDQAEEYLNIAARLDPNSSRVFAGLSFVHWQRAFLETAPDRPDEIKKACDFARHSVSLDPLDPLGHWALGRAMFLEAEFDQAVEELRAAVELNPNFAVGQYSLGFGIQFTSARAQGLDCVAKARRLSPYDPMTYAFLAQNAVLRGLAGDYDMAAEWARRAVRQPNAHYHILAIAAWCVRLVGEEEEARGYLSRLRALRPDYGREDYFRAFPFRSDERALIDGVLAGLGL